MKSLKLLFYLIKSRRYRYHTIGSFILIVSSISCIYLYFQSVNCLTQLSKYYNSQLEIQPMNNTIIDQSVVNLQSNCFIITNSYVFSLFGIIIGIIIIIIGIRKRKSNHSLY